MSCVGERNDVLLPLDVVCFVSFKIKDVQCLKFFECIILIFSKQEKE